MSKTVTLDLLPDDWVPIGKEFMFRVRRDSEGNITRKITLSEEDAERVLAARRDRLASQTTAIPVKNSDT